MKLLNYFILCFLRAEILEECGHVEREPVWSRLPSRLDNFGQVLDQNMNVGKIMGGKKVDPGNFPWQAALALNMEIFCGGTLVSPKTVISAAHCLTNYQKPEDLFVSVGHISSSFRRFFEFGHQYSRVKKIIRHKNYNSVLFLNDINLLLLEESFEITDYVRPACLPQLSEYKPQNGAACVASGFGQDGICDINKKFEATNLKNVVLEIVDNEVCAGKLEKFYIGEKLASSKLCAAGFQNGMDTCQGDSGGPLVCDVEGRWTLTGVVSSGLAFGEKEIPAVYTRVAEYLEWIWTNSEIEPQKPQIGLQSGTNILVILGYLDMSYITNGDGSQTSAVQISAPSKHYALNAQSAVVKGKLHLFGGSTASATTRDPTSKKIARLDDCTFVELPYKLNFDAFYFHAALSISDNSEALICFDESNKKSCDVFTGSSVDSTYSTSYTHTFGGLGFYNGQPITVGSSDYDGKRKVETLSSTGWTRLDDSPTNFYGHVLIGLGNDLLMIGGKAGYHDAHETAVWRLSDNNWSQETSLKQKVYTGTGIAIGNSIFIIGGDENKVSYSQKIDFDENDEIVGIEQIGVLDGRYYYPALFATSQNNCISN